jgi:hypothetical protein
MQRREGAWSLSDSLFGLSKRDATAWKQAALNPSLRHGQANTAKAQDEVGGLDVAGRTPSAHSCGLREPDDSP